MSNASERFISSAAFGALAILATTALSAPAQALEFASRINLSSLNGTTGFRLDGVAATDRSGVAIAGAGDVNGDGFADLIVGADLADPKGDNSGASYVVFGKASGFSPALNLSTLNGVNGFRLDGAAQDARSGYSVASAGDVNGDGFADLIVGARGASPNGYSSGSSYVVFGRTAGFGSTLNLGSLNGVNGFRIDGVAEYDYSGRSVSDAGDVNGDGFDDVIVGAFGADPHGDVSGSSYVVFGKASPFSSRLDLSALNGSNGFRLDGVASLDASGFRVASAGDINGDGFGDLVIGTPQADPNGSFSGSSYVVFGKTSGFSPTLNLSALNGANGFRLDGAAAYNYSGYGAAAAGDVKGDGLDDLIIGARGASHSGSASGSSYLVFGRSAGFAATLNLSSLDGSDGFRLDGVAETDASGAFVAGAGDVNGDGFGDLLIGAPNADPNGFSSGSSYVVFGKASGFSATLKLSTLNGANGFRLDGVVVSDFSGKSVAGAGDVNNDGFADVMVGAPFADPNGDASGASYVVFGRGPDRARLRIGSAAGQYVSGGGFADTLRGLGGKDEIEGRGGGDVLEGGDGSDIATHAHAPGPVKANLAAPGGNTGHAAGDSYNGIEGLTGSAFADTLTGNFAANVITGGKGRDLLRGNGGRDVFKYLKLSDSLPGATSDSLADFNAGTAATSIDKIDLGAIDANTNVNGNQAFTFIGTAQFQLNRPGRVRAVQSGTSALVSGDVNGDRVADFQIVLLNFSNLSGLTALDFNL